MPSVGMNTDISPLIDASVSGNTEQIIAVARELTQRGADASELIGRVGMIAAHGDSDGHAILTLDAASMMCRWLLALQYTLVENAPDNTRGLPFLVQPLTAVIPAVRTGEKAQKDYPAPLFPSGLADGQTVNSAMHDAVFANDKTMVERLMLGLYGTGADYRTMQIRVYDSISTTFQHAGHPLIFAVRGMQLLDAVEWGDRAPNIIHWLAPHLPLHTEEPGWVPSIRAFLSEPGHSLGSYRTRIAAPKEENALP
ncbi:MAG TPA: hypothetical protein VE843_17295, partial [Ktedonobacteraceae bacterium]|nr:hypothetical protein [Ktedonobacteraceae bacterium]